MSLFFANPIENDPLPQIVATPEEEADFIELSENDAPNYLLLEGRMGRPFKPARLYNWIETGMVNHFTNELITNLGHACDYAHAICEQYAEEDRLQRIETKRANNNRRQKEFQDRQKIKNADLYAARQLYKESVEQRKQVIANWNQQVLAHETHIAQWDAYVAQCKLEYNVVKAKGVK